MTIAAHKPARPGIWAGLFGVNVALIAVLQVTGAIEPPVPYLLLALNFVLLVPMMREGRRWQEEKGAMSPALRNYNWRFLGFSALYMLTMAGAAFAQENVEPASLPMWTLATLPLVPIMGMIWTMHRYLREESDEFLRQRAVSAALVGLGLVLVLSTAWGFLEMFGLVPHVWTWAVFPVWAIGLGIGMMLNPLPGDE